MDNDPFYFSGFELTITGPFPSNSGTPLLSGNASAYVQSSSISNPSGDPGPFVTVVPEPATMSLLALGGLAILRKRRRRA
ncbi:MAG: PEP-CTERM sorting domain-containing protein, partial [bacterium]|nr:PEP-CTERM sorting domain-containing protein [bacterium]